MKLEGITIIDFTRLLPGPLATQLMAEMGARVIKIESPNRPDPVRIPFNPANQESALFRILNDKKEIRRIDYEQPEGREEIMNLIGESDVVVEQFRPGAMKSWGLGYEEIAAVHPSVVYASITGYGQTGPRSREAGHDINYLARKGLLSLNRDEKGKPIIPGYQLADIGGAYKAIIDIQAALLYRFRTGKGTYLDISLSGAMDSFLTIPRALKEEGLDPFRFNILDGKTAVNYAVYACADGKWLAVGALELKFWNHLCGLIGKPEWRRKHQLELLTISFPKAEIEALFLSQPTGYWLELFEGEDVCVSLVDVFKDKT